MDVTLPEQIIIDALDFLGATAQAYYLKGALEHRDYTLMAWWDLARYIPVITMFQALETLEARGLDKIAWSVQQRLNV